VDVVDIEFPNRGKETIAKSTTMMTIISIFGKREIDKKWAKSLIGVVFLDKITDP
jgi:hypothetical protein